MEEIKRGDVVWLKSGGPPMTAATNPDKDGDVRCAWFDHDHHYDGSMFHVDMLTKAPPEPA